jgi:hypothetical protein
MYSRIINLQKLINAIAEMSEGEGWGAECEEFVVAEFAPIEEVIDLGNIHGSLFEMVDSAEKRFSGIVAAATCGSVERFERVEETVRAVGESMGIAGGVASIESMGRVGVSWDPVMVCSRIQEVLLDGMPCDRATEMVKRPDGSCEIVRNMDLHSSYFEAVGLDGEWYYRLLGAFVEGLLAGSGFKCEMENKCLRIGVWE